eukprot:gene17846-24233_t
MMTTPSLRAMLEVQAIMSNAQKASSKHEILTLPELVSIGKSWPLLRFVFPDESSKDLSDPLYTEQYANFLTAIEPSMQELVCPSNGSRSRVSNLMVCLECIHAMLMLGRVPATETWLVAIEATSQYCGRLVEMDRRLWPLNQGEKDTALHPAALLGHCLARLESEPGISQNAPAVMAELKDAQQTARLVDNLAGVLNAYVCDGTKVEWTIEANPTAKTQPSDEADLLKRCSGLPGSWLTPTMPQERVRNEYLPALYLLTALSSDADAGSSPSGRPQVISVYPGFLMRSVSTAAYRPHICHSRSTTNLAWAQMAAVISKCLSTDISASLDGASTVSFALAETYTANSSPSDPSSETSNLGFGALGPHEVAYWGNAASTQCWVEGLRSWTLDAKHVGPGGQKKGGAMPESPPDTGESEASVMSSVLAAVVEIGGYMPVPHRAQLVDALDRAVVAWQGSLPDHKLGPLMSSLGRMRKAANTAEAQDKYGVFSLTAKEANTLSTEMMERCWPEADTVGELFASASALVGKRHAGHMADLAKRPGGLAKELIRLGIMPAA